MVVHILLTVERANEEPHPRRLVIDSGAGETVMPSSWCHAHPIEDRPGKGRDYYVAADGKIIYNKGRRRLQASALGGGQARQMTFQVGAVTKA